MLTSQLTHDNSILLLWFGMHKQEHKLQMRRSKYAWKSASWKKPDKSHTFLTKNDGWHYLKAYCWGLTLILQVKLKFHYPQQHASWDWMLGVCARHSLHSSSSWLPASSIAPPVYFLFFPSHSLISLQSLSFLIVLLVLLFYVTVGSRQKISQELWVMGPHSV